MTNRFGKILAISDCGTYVVIKGEDFNSHLWTNDCSRTPGAFKVGHIRGAPIDYPSTNSCPDTMVTGVKTEDVLKWGIRWFDELLEAYGKMQRTEESGESVLGKGALIVAKMAWSQRVKFEKGIRLAAEKKQENDRKIISQGSLACDLDI